MVRSVRKPPPVGTIVRGKQWTGSMWAPVHGPAQEGGQTEAGPATKNRLSVPTTAHGLSGFSPVPGSVESRARLVAGRLGLTGPMLKQPRAAAALLAGLVGLVLWGLNAVPNASDSDHPGANDVAWVSDEQSLGTTIDGSLDEAVPVPVGLDHGALHVNYPEEGPLTLELPSGDTVSRSGPYEGTVVYDTESAASRTIAVTAEGDWTLTFFPLEAVPTLDLPVQGVGNAVFRVSGGEYQEVFNEGDSSLSIRGMDGDGFWVDDQTVDPGDSGVAYLAFGEVVEVRSDGGRWQVGG